MLNYRETNRNPHELTIGHNFGHISYDFCLTEANRDDYERLAKDIARRGFVNPLIVWRGSVLIGQRRCLIARDMGLPSVPCWEITEDITHDANPDRVVELQKKGYRKADY